MRGPSSARTRVRIRKVDRLMPSSARQPNTGGCYSRGAPMLQALLVTFREGIESFLIVGVVAAYLKKSGRAGLLRGVKIGLAVSVVTCLAGAWLWLQVPNQPLYEGIAALTAALVVGALLIQMVRS